MRIRLAGDATRHLVIDRSMLEDPRLSFRAKGLLAYLLAHPHVDLSNKRQMASVSLEGPDAVLTALQELEAAGYLRRLSSPDGENTGDEVGVVYPVSRIPVLEAQSFHTPDAEAIADDSTEKLGKLPPKKKPSEIPAQRVIDRLNDLRKAAWDWARYTPLSGKYAKNVEHINGRLSDGYSEDDLVLVLEYLAAVDGGKETSRKYFDCVTPFNTKNFERNLAMARDWDAKGRQATRDNLSFQRVPGHDPEIYEKRLTGGTA